MSLELYRDDHTKDYAKSIRSLWKIIEKSSIYQLFEIFIIGIINLLNHVNFFTSHEIAVRLQLSKPMCVLLIKLNSEVDEWFNANDFYSF
jgi:hypothetical protein